MKLVTDKNTINCVIMASGFSSRFGENKIIRKFKGSPLINYVLKATDNLFNERIVVSRYDEVKKICDSFNIKCVLHNKKYKSDTIKIGIENLANSKLPCTFIACDQPLLKRSTISEMINMFFKNKDYIIRLAYEDEYSTPVIFPEWTINELKSLNWEQGGSTVINKHPDRVKNFQASSKHELIDVDTKETFEELEFLQ